jgi:hypothetical protein
VTTTTDTTARFVATCDDGCAVRIEHRDGDDIVLLDVLLDRPDRRRARAD